MKNQKRACFWSWTCRSCSPRVHVTAYRLESRTLDNIEPCVSSASAFAKHVFAATIVKVWRGGGTWDCFAAIIQSKSFCQISYETLSQRLHGRGFQEKFLLEINDQERETVTFIAFRLLCTANHGEVAIATWRPPIPSYLCSQCQNQSKRSLVTRPRQQNSIYFSFSRSPTPEACKCCESLLGICLLCTPRTFKMKKKRRQKLNFLLLWFQSEDYEHWKHPLRRMDGKNGAG